MAKPGVNTGDDKKGKGNKNKGKDKGGKDHGKDHQPNLRKRAMRDVQLGIQPGLQQLHREQQQTKRQYKTLGKAYGGIRNDYAGQSEGVISALQKALGAFGGPVQGGNADEAAAFAGASGALGQGYLGMLGAEQTGQLGYFGDLQGAGALDRVATLQDIGQQRQDILSGVPAAFHSRLDELRQQHLEDSLARKQFQLNKQETEANIESQGALSQLLQDNLSNLLGGGGGGGGGGGFGGGGHPGSPGGAPPGAGPAGSTQGGGAFPTASTPASLLRFAGGDRSFTDLSKFGRHQVRQNIVPFFGSHPGRFQDYEGKPHPGDLISFLMQKLYTPHGAQ